jgi:hypothetical protein
MNTDASDNVITMRRCPSYEENYELKPHKPVLPEDIDYEDDGNFTCCHGIEMSMRDPTICDECYWNSRSSDERLNYNESLKRQREEESCNIDLYHRDVTYYGGAGICDRHEMETFLKICQRIAEYESRL